MAILHLVQGSVEADVVAPVTTSVATFGRLGAIGQRPVAFVLFVRYQRRRQQVCCRSFFQPFYLKGKHEEDMPN